MEEMNLVVKEMPHDKDPGQDCFNGLVLKQWWHVIKKLYKLAEDFNSGTLNLQNINGSIFL